MIRYYISVDDEFCYSAYDKHGAIWVPNPHISGEWRDDFEFNNVALYQLAVL